LYIFISLSWVVTQYIVEGG